MTRIGLSPEDLAVINAAIAGDAVRAGRAPDLSDRSTTMWFDTVSGPVAIPAKAPRPSGWTAAEGFGPHTVSRPAEQVPAAVLDEGLDELMEETDAGETKAPRSDDWVAVLTERLRDCLGVLLVAPDTKRQQVESRWTHGVFLVERAEGGFRWSQRGGTDLGWIAAPRVLATLDEVCQKMSIANGVEAELAKSKPPGEPAVSYWQHRAERLNDHLVGLMRSATQRLHDDLCAEEFDLDEVAARAADIAETLRVLAEA